jgi:DNA-binding beta-propeller fold protein YncE
MIELDARGLAVPQIGAALIARFNESAPGSRLAAVVDECGPQLRMWLLEAGARHSVARIEEGWRIVIERALCPAQGSVPGVHHVVTDGHENVWTCERGAHVARIDVSGECVAACTRVAQKASHLALDLERRTLIVADPAADRVLALDADTLAVRDSWYAPGMPQLPVVSEGGIVCATGGIAGTLTIARPRGAIYQEQVISVGQVPHDPLLARDGAHVFVPCAGSSEIVKVRLSDGVIAGRCSVGNGPAHLAGHPDGSRVYSANSWDGTLSCLTTDGELVRTVPSGRWAHAIDITSDGKTVWVANFFDDTLAVFDAQTLERLAVLDTERYAHGLDVSADGRYVVATGFSSDCVRVYDAHRFIETGRIAVGRGSSHTAFLRDGGTAYIGCSVSDHVAGVDLGRAQLFGTFRLDNEVLQ